MGKLRISVKGLRVVSRGSLRLCVRRNTIVTEAEKTFCEREATLKIMLKRLNNINNPTRGNSQLGSYSYRRVR